MYTKHVYVDGEELTEKEILLLTSKNLAKWVITEEWNPLADCCGGGEELNTWRGLVISDEGISLIRKERG